MSVEVRDETLGGAVEQDRIEYRALSNSAVISAVLGVLSVMTFITGSSSLEGALVVSFLPMVGLLLGIRALIQIKRYPDELAGGAWALTGIVLSLFFLVGGLSWASYVYATEVPPGYQRIRFSQLKPDAEEEALGQPIPSDIEALGGKQVFIKGYMRPSAQSLQLDEFLLVRDNNECCFGALSDVKYYDQVQVKLTGGLLADYDTGIFRVAGTLKIDPRGVWPGASQPVFSLTANYIK